MAPGVPVCIGVSGISGRLLAQRPAGQGEEDVVQGGPAHRHPGQRDARRIQITQQADDDAFALGHPERHRVRVAVGLADRLGRPGQASGQHQGGVRIAGHRDGHQIAGDAPLELVRGALGDDPPAIDHQDPVAQRVRLVQVMRRDEHRRPGGAPQICDVPPHVGPALRVQPGGRLVEEDQFGGVHQAQRDVQPALLPAGQRLHVATAQARQIQTLQQFLRPAPGVGGAHPVELRLEDQLLAHPGVGSRAPALRHVPDGAADRRRVPPQVVPGHRGLSGSGFQQRGQHLQRGGLPRAVGPEEPHDLPAAHVQIDAAHRLHRALAAAIGLRQAAGADHLRTSRWGHHDASRRRSDVNMTPSWPSMTSNVKGPGRGAESAQCGPVPRHGRGIGPDSAGRGLRAG
jgi:hypothetical protein